MSKKTKKIDTCKKHVEKSVKSHLKGDAKELKELSKGVKEMQKDDKAYKKKLK